MANSHFHYVILIRTTPERLWEALTEPDFTRQYWHECWQESDWTVGSPWRMMTPDGRVSAIGEVVEYNPPRRLIVTWRKELLAEMAEEGFSRMTCELEPLDDVVKLTLTHEMDRPDSKLIAGVSRGWPAILCSLKSLLETGEPLEATRRWPKGL